MRLSNVDDISGIQQSYSEIKRINYIKELNGYKPDELNSIKTVFDIVDDVFTEGTEELVVFAVDAISFHYFSNDVFPLVKNKNDKFTTVLSSVFPTTTSSSWLTVVTGSWPSEHGVYGTSFYQEELKGNYLWINNTLNINDMRTFLGKDDPFNLTLTPKQTIFQKLQKKNVVSYYLGNHGVSELNPIRHHLTLGAEHIKPAWDYPNSKLQPRLLLDNLLKQVPALLNEKNKKKLIWIYVDFDDYIHEYGYSCLTSSKVWDDIFSFWDGYKSEKRKFILMSDHGQVKQDKTSFNALRESQIPSLFSSNTGGAGRVLYFYPQIGKEKKALGWVESMVKDTGIILRKDDLVKYKLLQPGFVAPQRIGDIIAIAGSSSFKSAGNMYEYEHGALTEHEMFVPFVMQI
ncbi:alkaline phosphatase family protein [Paenibacillus sp. FSL H8-0122]|uniref:alkaline phosphatase family protein n=1 Tax=Paenibacillus sp. FSL H8-0122 TaxID=2954510 RepID=UPI0030F88D46